MGGQKRLGQTIRADQSPVGTDVTFVPSLFRPLGKHPVASSRQDTRRRDDVEISGHWPARGGENEKTKACRSALFLNARQMSRPRTEGLMLRTGSESSPLHPTAANGICDHLYRLSTRMGSVRWGEESRADASSTRVLLRPTVARSPERGRGLLATALRPHSGSPCCLSVFCLKSPVRPDALFSLGCCSVRGSSVDQSRPEFKPSTGPDTCQRKLRHSILSARGDGGTREDDARSPAQTSGVCLPIFFCTSRRWAQNPSLESTQPWTLPRRREKT